VADDSIIITRIAIFDAMSCRNRKLLVEEPTGENRLLHHKNAFVGTAAA